MVTQEFKTRAKKFCITLTPGQILELDYLIGDAEKTNAFYIQLQLFVKVLMEG